MDENTGTLIELDSRRRTTLRVGNAEHTRYLARATADGTIVLEPAVVLTEHELRLREQRPDVYAKLDKTYEPDEIVADPEIEQMLAEEGLQ